MAKKSVSSSTYYKSPNRSDLPAAVADRMNKTVRTEGGRSSLPESVHQRMMRANTLATLRANTAKRPASADIDIRGYFGDERTGIRKNVGPLAPKAKAVVKAAPAKAKTKAPPAVVRTTTNMKLSPAKAAAPARMAVNRVTGNTTGFSSGTTTGKTTSKSGTAGRTSMSSFGRSEAARASRGVGGK